MYYIRMKDGRRWKVREATSIKAACSAIANAAVSGSVGSSTYVNDVCVADVVQVNSDNTERRPYTAAY